MLSRMDMQHAFKMEIVTGSFLFTDWVDIRLTKIVRKEKISMVLEVVWKAFHVLIL